MRTKKVVLQRFDAQANVWVAFYPTVAGESVQGQVADAAKLGGRDATMYLSKNEAIRVADENGQPALLVTGRAVVSPNAEEENKAADGELFVNGEIYARNGERVATMTDITNLEARVRNVKTNRSVEADRLASPVRINGELFDGTNDVTITTFVISASEPADKKKLWINSSDQVLCYYDGMQWTPVVGVWG